MKLLQLLKEAKEAFEDFAKTRGEGAAKIASNRPSAWDGELRFSFKTLGLSSTNCSSCSDRLKRLKF